MNVGKQVMEWKAAPPSNDPPKQLYQEGDLVKGSGEKVYLIKSGNKQWIPNPGIKRQNDLEGKSIKILSDEELGK